MPKAIPMKKIYLKNTIKYFIKRYYKDLLINKNDTCLKSVLYFLTLHFPSGNHLYKLNYNNGKRINNQAGELFTMV